MTRLARSLGVSPRELTEALIALPVAVIAAFGLWLLFSFVAVTV